MELQELNFNEMKEINGGAIAGALNVQPGNDVTKASVSVQSDSLLSIFSGNAGDGGGDSVGPSGISILDILGKGSL